MTWRARARCTRRRRGWTKPSRRPRLVWRRLRWRAATSQSRRRVRRPAARRLPRAHPTAGARVRAPAPGSEDAARSAAAGGEHGVRREGGHAGAGRDAETAAALRRAAAPTRRISPRASSWATRSSARRSYAEAAAATKRAPEIAPVRAPSARCAPEQLRRAACDDRQSRARRPPRRRAGGSCARWRRRTPPGMTVEKKKPARRSTSRRSSSRTLEVLPVAFNLARLVEDRGMVADAGPSRPAGGVAEDDGVPAAAREHARRRRPTSLAAAALARGRWRRDAAADTDAMAFLGHLLMKQGRWAVAQAQFKLLRAAHKPLGAQAAQLAAAAGKDPKAANPATVAAMISVANASYYQAMRAQARATATAPRRDEKSSKAVKNTWSTPRRCTSRRCRRASPTCSPPTGGHPARREGQDRGGQGDVPDGGRGAARTRRRPSSTRRARAPPRTARAGSPTSGSTRGTSSTPRGTGTPPPRMSRSGAGEVLPQPGPLGDAVPGAQRVRGCAAVRGAALPSEDAAARAARRALEPPAAIRPGVCDPGEGAARVSDAAARRPEDRGWRRRGVRRHESRRGVQQREAFAWFAGAIFDQLATVANAARIAGGDDGDKEERRSAARARLEFDKSFRCARTRTSAAAR